MFVKMLHLMNDPYEVEANPYLQYVVVLYYRKFFMKYCVNERDSRCLQLNALLSSAAFDPFIELSSSFIDLLPSISLLICVNKDDLQDLVMPLSVL